MLCSIQKLPMKTSQLEQTTAIQILFYLLGNREAKMTELMHELRSSQHPIYAALNVLRELGLINEEVVPYPLKRIFTLTEKGRRVAEKLRDVEGILSEA
jgi:DNA-binding PadR family transcriptional regulator